MTWVWEKIRARIEGGDVRDRRAIVGTVDGVIRKCASGVVEGHLRQ